MDSNNGHCLLVAKSIIKTLIEPIVMDRVRRFGGLVEKHGLNKGDLVVMITGGAALERYFYNLPPLMTTDWDLKFMTKVELKNKIPLETQNKIRREFGEKLVQDLNKYIRGILDKLIVTLRDLDLELLETDGEIFCLEEDWALLDIIRYKIKFEDGSGESDNVVDLFTPNIERNPWLKDWTNLPGGDPVLAAGNNGPYYIPYNRIDNILYETLGYALWDTERMIEDSIRKGKPKLERYREKRKAIIVGLSDPSASLTCYTMSHFLDKCNMLPREICADRSGRFFTREEIVNFGIENGVFDPNSSELLLTFSRPYLCDLYHRLYIRITKYEY